MFEGEYEKVKKLRTWKNISPNTWEKVPFEAEVIFANFSKERKCVSNVMERKNVPKKLQSSASHQTKGLTLVEAGGGLEILLRLWDIISGVKKLPIEEHYLKNYYFFCLFYVTVFLVSYYVVNNFWGIRKCSTPVRFSCFWREKWKKRVRIVTFFAQFCIPKIRFFTDDVAPHMTNVRFPILLVWKINSHSRKKESISYPS